MVLFVCLFDLTDLGQAYRDYLLSICSFTCHWPWRSINPKSPKRAADQRRSTPSKAIPLLFHKPRVLKAREQLECLDSNPKSPLQSSLPFVQPGHRLAKQSPLHWKFSEVFKEKMLQEGPWTHPHRYFQFPPKPMVFPVPFPSFHKPFLACSEVSGKRSLSSARSRTVGCSPFWPAPWPRRLVIIC